MLKQLIFLVTIFCSVVTYSQENTFIEVAYEIITQDYTAEELAAIKDPNVRNRIVAGNNSIKGEKFILIGDYKNAQFKSVEIMSSDANRTSFTDANLSEFYYDIPKNKVFESTNLGGEPYTIFYPMELNNWKITNETKQINGYLCYKATGVRKIDDIRGKSEHILEAWFCPTLPYRYGPQMYFGLPGLVFEAFTVNRKAKYVIKSLKFSNARYQEVMPKGKEISEKEAGAVVIKIIENMRR